MRESCRIKSTKSASPRNDPVTTTQATPVRQQSGRRRLVDPTTCERDYTRDELEFMNAVHDYTARSGRLFPTYSEILEVLRALGYQKNETGAGR
jgi:hypothetical protein